MQVRGANKPQSPANRASFFGGAVSTREAAAAPGWRAAVQQEAPAPQRGPVAKPRADGRGPPPRPSERQGPAAGGAPPAAGPDLEAAEQARRQRQRANFADLDGGCDAPAELPTPLPSGAGVSPLPRAHEGSDSRGHAAGVWPRSAPTANGAHGQRRPSASPPVRNTGFGRALGPGGRVGGASLTPEKRPAAAEIIQPKGRKGAAARGAAIVPQARRPTCPDRVHNAVGGTRKQMADEALRSQILAMRQQQRPPAGTGPWDGAAARPYMSRSTGAPPGASAAAPRPGSYAGLNGYARRPVNASLGGKRDRGADAEDTDFIEDDAGGGDGDWRAMLRAVTGGYDPSKFRDEGDDRRMVASRAEIEAEERRSARAARGEDERAAAEEARAAAAKAAKKKKRRRGDSSFMLA